MDKSSAVQKIIRKKKVVTRLNPTQKNDCVSGRVNDLVAFYINPRVKPTAHYLLHVRAIGNNNEKWSKRYAKELGGVHKPATKGHDACVAIKALSLQQVEKLIDQFAILSDYVH